jgi:hypothetical protein
MQGIRLTILNKDVILNLSTKMIFSSQIWSQRAKQVWNLYRGSIPECLRKNKLGVTKM